MQARLDFLQSPFRDGLSWNVIADLRIFLRPPVKSDKTSLKQIAIHVLNHLYVAACDIHVLFVVWKECDI